MCQHAGKATADQKLYPVGPRKHQHKIRSNWWLNPCRPSFQWALAETWVLLNLTANRSKAERITLFRQPICGTSWSSSFFWKPCGLASLRLWWKWSPTRHSKKNFLCYWIGKMGTLSSLHSVLLICHGNCMVTWLYEFVWKETGQLTAFSGC